MTKARDGGFFCDRKFRRPRLWSNRLLRELAPLFEGSVVNVSAWKDEDKEGRHYRDYFPNAERYALTNWKPEARGLQGTEDEIPLDLEAPCPPELQQRFDHAFCHTVLEHVFEIRQAFHTLCELSRDTVILVVPFLQPMHDAHYGDYWRFTPQTLHRLFEAEGLSIVHLDYNAHPETAVYLLAVATRHPERWRDRLPPSRPWLDPRAPWDGSTPYPGCHALPNRPLSWRRRLARLFRRPKPKPPAALPGVPRGPGSETEGL